MWLYLPCIFLLLSKAICTALALGVFGNFTPLVDANNYLSGYYLMKSVPLRTQLIQESVILIKNIGGDLFVHWVFGIFSLVGALYYFLRGGRDWRVCFIFFSPSALVWTSVVGKEAIFFGMFTLSIFIWHSFLNKESRKTDWAILAIASIICFVLRPHYAMLTAYLFLSTFGLKFLKMRHLIWGAIFSAALIVCLYKMFWDEYVFYGLRAIDMSARATRDDWYVYLFSENAFSDDVTVSRFNLVLLGAMVLGIIGIYPPELLSRPEFVLFFIEGLVILMFPIWVYRYAKRRSMENWQQFKQLFWFCLGPCFVLAMIIHAPFGLLNPGSAVRWRVNFEAIFTLAPLLLYWSCLRTRVINNENTPFPR